MIRIRYFIRRFINTVASPKTRVKLGLLLRHRRRGYVYLMGRGIEIGALHIPALLPACCSTEYADAITTEEARVIFPEINPRDFSPVKHIVDLDTSSFGDLLGGGYDYVILNHVIEHVANPINTIRDIFLLVRPGGHVVISAPDKNFTFDRSRNLTPFSHLLDEFENNVTKVTDDHYLDFVKSTLDVSVSIDQATLMEKVQDARRRREHAHIWDSNTFYEFMIKSLELLKVHAEPIFVSTASENGFEYFSVWKKLN